MSNQLLFIVVPGIWNVPGSYNSFAGKAVRWIHRHAKRLQEIHGAEVVVAEAREYFTPAWRRWLGHRARVHSLRRQMDFSRDWRKRIICHSNGGNVVLDALRESEWPEVEQLDIISGACESDLGYLGPRLGKEIKRMRVWIGERDKPLWWAGLGNKLHIGRPLGFGTLGLDGIQGVMPGIKEQFTEEIRRPDFGHSTWFQDEHFDATMEKLVGFST